MQQAFVTGGSGFIGSEVIRQLVSKGIHVKALLRSTSSQLNLSGVDFEIIHGDLNNLEALKRGVAGVDYVYHLAGVVSAKRPIDFFLPNATGTENLAKACAQANTGKLKRFVYVSSLAASGPSTSCDPRLESEDAAPVSAYGRSKLEGEKLLLKHAGKIPVTIVRPPAVYGPRDRGIFEFVKMVNSGWIPVLPSKDPSGEKFLSLIFVEDLVRGILMAGLNGNQGPVETFFLSDGRSYPWSEIMSVIAKSLGKNPRKLKIPAVLLQTLATAGSVVGKVINKPVPLNLDKLQELTADYWICSSDSARRKLGFDAEYNLIRGMQKTVDWYRQNRWI